GRAARAPRRCSVSFPRPLWAGTQGAGSRARQCVGESFWPSPRRRLRLRAIPCMQGSSVPGPSCCAPTGARPRPPFPRPQGAGELYERFEGAFARVTIEKMRISSYLSACAFAEVTSALDLHRTAIVRSAESREDRAEACDGDTVSESSSVAEVAVEGVGMAGHDLHVGAEVGDQSRRHFRPAIGARCPGKRKAECDPQERRRWIHEATRLECRGHGLAEVDGNVVEDIVTDLRQ